MYKRCGFWPFEDEGYEKIENGLFSSKCLWNSVFCKVQLVSLLSFSESICKESEDVDVDVDVDVPPHVQELVATDNSRFEDWVMQVKAFRVRWFGSSDMVTGNHGNHSPL